MIEPSFLPDNRFVLGLGSRFWYRQLPSGTDTSGDPIIGYEETWWTIYPYLGWEGRHEISMETEWFASLRLGLTAFTHEEVSYFDVSLRPQPGITGQADVGVRGRHYSLAVHFEAMTWAQSSYVQDGWGDVICQPDSQMYTVGLTGGCHY